MIRCPTCGFDAVYVVEATPIETGVALTFPVGAVLLEADGFCLPLPTGADGSTTDEVAECGACGRCGPLADFGFGDCGESAQEADREPEEPASYETTLRLTLTVTYRLTGQDRDEMAWQLRRVATLAADNGQLTGATGAEVQTWQADVAEVVNSFLTTY